MLSHQIILRFCLFSLLLFTYIFFQKIKLSKNKYSFSPLQKHKLTIRINTQNTISPVGEYRDGSKYETKHHIVEHCSVYVENNSPMWGRIFM